MVWWITRVAVGIQDLERALPGVELTAERGAPGRPAAVREPEGRHLRGKTRLMAYCALATQASGARTVEQQCSRGSKVCWRNTSRKPLLSCLTFINTIDYVRETILCSERIVGDGSRWTKIYCLGQQHLRQLHTQKKTKHFLQSGPYQHIQRSNKTQDGQSIVPSSSRYDVSRECRMMCVHKGWPVVGTYPIMISGSR